MSLVPIALFVAGAIFSYKAAVASNWRGWTAYLLLSIGTFGLSAYTSKLSPYLILGSLVVVTLSLMRFVSPATSRVLTTSGVALFASSLIVVIARLFQSPTEDDMEAEDRENYTPPLEVTTTLEETLDRPWSTYDEHSHWPVASLMLELSEVAYQPPVEARKRLQELGFSASESVSGGSMQGYVSQVGKHCVITLRGTEKHEYDILQDLRFLKSRFDQGSMHGGFATGYAPLHAQIMDLLEQYNSKRVWITGHSLGGGLAVVCAHRLTIEGRYPIAGVMTFGQPKVVREDLASYLGPQLDGSYVFFVNDMDPITRLIDPYLHFGHMVRWTGSEIQRSRPRMRLAASSNASDEDTDVTFEEGYIDSMSDRELEELIKQMEGVAEVEFEDMGRQAVRGTIPSGTDHFLTSYRHMLEMLRTHSTSPG